MNIGNLRTSSALPVVIDNSLTWSRSPPSCHPSFRPPWTCGDARGGSPIRLILCGSALTFMGGLLAGNAPLRGRAGLELIVPTLDYRLAAEFWQISDPRLALLTHAVVGGTPAYRREYVRDDTPRSLGDFDDWIERAVLNPARPLFREACYLLAEEPDLHDAASLSFGTGGGG